MVNCIKSQIILYDEHPYPPGSQNWIVHRLMPFRIFGESLNLICETVEQTICCFRVFQLMVDVISKMQ